MPTTESMDEFFEKEKEKKEFPEGPRPPSPGMRPMAPHVPLQSGIHTMCEHMRALSARIEETDRVFQKTQPEDPKNPEGPKERIFVSVIKTEVPECMEASKACQAAYKKIAQEYSDVILDTQKTLFMLVEQCDSILGKVTNKPPVRLRLGRR